MEGSLNFQLADFFSSCTAGDIRGRYRTVTIDPSIGATVIGQLRDAETGEIGVFTTSRGYRLGS